MRLIEQSFLLHRNVLRDRVMGKKILMRPTMILIPADWLHQDQVQPVAFRSSKLVQWSFPFLSYSLETHSLTPATHSLPEKSYHIFTHRSLLPKANSSLNVLEPCLFTWVDTCFHYFLSNQKISERYWIWPARSLWLRQLAFDRIPEPNRLSHTLLTDRKESTDLNYFTLTTALSRKRKGMSKA